MTKVRGRTPTADPLFQELVLVMLWGWSAPTPAGAESDFRVFDFSHEQMAALWTEHQVMLRETAEALNIPRLWPKDERLGPPTRFFGEDLAFRLARGERI